MILQVSAESVRERNRSTDAWRVREPNFFIVGAARAGTTSLWAYLRQHPDVFLPQSELAKEPTYFADVTPPWAPEFATLEGYQKVFEAATYQRAVGEASTAYLSSPESPGRIHAAFPDAKIIIVLRNPAGRAYSHYRLLCELGFEPSPTFERGLELEAGRYERYEQGLPLPPRIDRFWYGAYFYQRMGRYGEQIERYLKLFRKEQLHFVLFDDLQKHPIETTSAVCNFLGVDPSFRPNVQIHNQSYFPLSVAAQCFIGQRWRLHPVGSHTRPPRRRDSSVLPMAFGLNLWLGHRLRKVALKAETRRRLLDELKDDITHTSEIIGRNLDHWLKERA
jgi:sulfotransferase family protein